MYNSQRFFEQDNTNFCCQYPLTPQMLYDKMYGIRNFLFQQSFLSNSMCSKCGRLQRFYKFVTFIGMNTLNIELYMSNYNNHL